MPLGMMNKRAGEMIGDLVGEVLEVDADDRESVIGQFLRVKVKLDIWKPLMRGVTLDMGIDGKEEMKWCPLVYEYLPDFCYTCGLIGHTDWSCDVQLEKGVTQQYNKTLRFIPEKKRGSDESWGKALDSRPHLSWRSSKGRGAGGSNSGGSGGYRGSGSSNWRKGGGPSEEKAPSKGEEQEVTSPLKAQKKEMQVEGIKKALLPAVMDTTMGVKSADLGGTAKPVDSGVVETQVVMNSTMQMAPKESGVQAKTNSPPQLNLNASTVSPDNKKLKSGTPKTFKWVKRSSRSEKKEVVETLGEKKRNQEEEDGMDVDEEGRGVKVGRFAGESFGANTEIAGPTDWSCGTQSSSLLGTIGG